MIGMAMLGFHPSLRPQPMASGKSLHLGGVRAQFIEAPASVTDTNRT